MFSVRAPRRRQWVRGSRSSGVPAAVAVDAVRRPITNSRSVVARALSAAALCAASPVLAETASFPPSGETSYVTHYTGKVIDTEYLGEGASESLVDMTGVSRNTAGQSAFDGMHAHCLMRSAIASGKPSVSGACTETDRDGDHVFTSFDRAAYKLIGGTGKYRGISGSALYSVTPEPSVEQGRYGYVMKHDVTWTIGATPPAGCARCP